MAAALGAAALVQVSAAACVQVPAGPNPYRWPGGRYEGLLHAELRGDVGAVVNVNDADALYSFRHDEITRIHVEGRQPASGSRAWLMFTCGKGQISPMILADGQIYLFPEDPSQPNPYPVRPEVRACSGPADGDEIFDARLTSMTWWVTARDGEGDLRVRFTGVLEADRGEPSQSVEGVFDLAGAEYEDSSDPLSPR